MRVHKQQQLFPLISLMFVLAAIMTLVQAQYVPKVWHIHIAVSCYLALNLLYGIVKQQLRLIRVAEFLAVAALVEFIAIVYLV